MIVEKKQSNVKLRRALLRWLALGLLFASTHALAQTGGTVTYVYTDPQGTPLAETDASGNITATFDYTPYGTYAPNGTSTPGPNPNGPGYTGHVNDPETNLVYMQARYYDPATGHFLSVDPVAPTSGNTPSFNRYAYANNNPILNVDPNGRETGAGYGNGEYGVYSHVPSKQELRFSDQVDDALDKLLQPLVAEVPEFEGAAELIAEVRTASTVEVKVVASDSDVPAAILERNKAQGKAGEDQVRENLGSSVAGEQVTFKTSDGTRTRTDFVTIDNDVVEVKTGKAKLSPGQAKLKADIDNGRPVTPVGKNAAKAGLKPGQATTMRFCGVYRC
jgi:RHS repeat-associated protein